ncbi:MAG TPA: Crp/Fnr family transcriptional regulator [Geminicoccus sp.]|uniref:Crp/Fnr family transcriptional regulator n=1 Tax=Geminicoccus sp. TaxID=2024832 RepID=UPI002E343A0B|nr:Crp/Fnr family transcriptional regulator [Geminicoccus sp.]HEX2525464.1 Crp/Fnr family transcriptional regulator [Geminicoccus sp.]
MASSIPFTPSIRNRLLAALPPGSLAKLWPQLTPVDLELRQVLHRPEEPIATVYFPERGWCSMLAPLEDGDSGEVGLVGWEGVTALPVILGEAFDDLEVMVQCPGTALSMGADSLRAAMEGDPVLRTLLLRYVMLHHGQVARTAACNGRHHTDQRLARWLLMSHDRAEGDEFPMTHEFLSMMLGVRRAGITIAAGALQKAGMISYRGGRMRITDRPGLESSACECYGISRRASERLFGLNAGTRGEYWR